MAKYHVNSAGNAGVCKAQAGNCPYGGDDKHYTSAEAARGAYEEHQRNQIVPQIEQDLEEFGEDSAVFREWAKIHPDFKTPAKQGESRKVMAFKSGVGSVLTPWRGPKALEQVNKALEHRVAAMEPSGAMAGWRMSTTRMELNHVHFDSRYFDTDGKVYVVDEWVKGRYAKLTRLDNDGKATDERTLVGTDDGASPRQFLLMTKIPDERYSDGVAGSSESQLLKPVPPVGQSKRLATLQFTYQDENGETRRRAIMAPIGNLTKRRKLELGRQLWSLTGKDPKRFEDAGEETQLEWSERRIIVYDDVAWHTENDGYVSYSHSRGGGGYAADEVFYVELDS